MQQQRNTRRYWLWLVCLTSLVGCSSGGWSPYAGGTGRNKSYAAPVTQIQYNYEDVHGGDINGGCISNIRALELNKVGKDYSNEYGSSCGQAYVPAKWKPGLTARVSWTILPYPEWHPGYKPKGGIDDEKFNIIMRYTENPYAVIPLPPPPASMGGDDFGRTTGIEVHFMACHQIFITYGMQDYSPEEQKELDKLLFELFHKSQKLCRKLPVIKSFADYHKHKAEMDALREERKQIPQVILPEYMQQLEAAGKLPHQQPKEKP